MFSLICTWINGRMNNREAGDLRRHSTHYDVIVMTAVLLYVQVLWEWWIKHQDKVNISYSVIYIISMQIRKHFNKSDVQVTLKFYRHLWWLHIIYSKSKRICWVLPCSNDLNSAQELYNPLSEAVHDKVHGSDRNNKGNILEVQASFHRARTWCIILILHCFMVSLVVDNRYLIYVRGTIMHTLPVQLRTNMHPLWLTSTILICR